MKIKKSELVSAYAQSIGIEAAENLISKKINAAGLGVKGDYSREEVARICGELIKEEGLVRIVAQTFLFQLEQKLRQEIEEEWWKSKERLRALIETIPDIVCFKDTEGKNVVVNKAYERFLGLEKEEIIGKTDEQFLPLDLVGWNKRLDEKVIKRSEIPHIEQRTKDSKGREIIFDTIKVPFYDKRGKIVGLMGISRDITDRKRMEEVLRESEKKYRSLVESTEDSVYLVDRDCRYLFVNDKHLSRLGLPIEKIIGKTYGDLHSPEEAKEFAEIVDQVFETDKSVRHEHRSRRDGRYFLRTLSPIKVPELDERATVVTVVSKDITVLKWMEAELKAKNAELEKFTYVVSHDLRSPLVTIEGFVGMLRKDLEKNKGKEVENDLKYIENAVTKMGTLLDDTLRLSRISRVMNPPEDVSFREIVQEALEQNAEKIKSNTIEVSVAENFPTVHVDRMRIEEALMNLINNSINYMGEQPHPKIEIGHRVKGNETIFFVKDNGIGIDKSEHDKVFRAFLQSE